MRGQLIHETEFARDPKHPRWSPDVRDLVATPASLPLVIRRAEAGLPERGMVIGEAASPDDLRQWATLRNHRWLMAGGAEYFGALLNLPPSTSQPRSAAGRELFVCGSASEVTRNFVTRQAGRAVPVFSLPPELAVGGSFDAGSLNALASQVAASFRTVPRVILHVGLPPVKDVAAAEWLALRLVAVAKEVLFRVQVSQVFAEGGATAVALARQMGWQRLQVTAELAPGVVTLASEGEHSMSFTMKPGSYAWPEAVTELRFR